MLKRKRFGKKLFSLLLMLMLMLTLMPTTAFAYTEGEIAGTTGSGTESDPVIVDNFAELKAAMTRSDIQYVQLNSPYEGHEELLPEMTTYDVAIRVTRTGTPKTLILNGDSTFICSFKSTYDFLLGVTGDLTIKGNGKLGFRAVLSEGVNSVVRVEGGGTLTVNDPNTTLKGDINSAVYGTAISVMGAHSKLNIGAGNFTGISAIIDPLHLYSNTARPVWAGPHATVNISGGTFKASIQNGSEAKPYGLVINEAANVLISGGSFQGFYLPKGKTLEDYLFEGATYSTDTGTGMTTVTVPFLKFSDDPEYDVPAGIQGDIYTASKEFTAIGGTPPYTFTVDPAVDGMSINSDNKLVFTRPDICSAAEAAIKATDADGQTETITINVGKVVSATLNDITKVEVTGIQTLVAGQPCITDDIKVTTTPENAAHVKNIYWIDEADGLVGPSDKFIEGHKYYLNVYLEPELGYAFRFKNTRYTGTATFNGETSFIAEEYDEKKFIYMQQIRSGSCRWHDNRQHHQGRHYRRADTCGRPALHHRRHNGNHRSG